MRKGGPMGIGAARNATDNARTVRRAICGALIGPEGEGCAVPSPCPEHEKAQTMAARIVELEGHREQWRRSSARAEEERDRLLEILLTAHDVLLAIHDEYDSGLAVTLSRDAVANIRRLLPNVDWAGQSESVDR